LSDKTGIIAAYQTELHFAG